jgi:hypothetical protein
MRADDEHAVGAARKYADDVRRPAPGQRLFVEMLSASCLREHAQQPRPAFAVRAAILVEAPFEGFAGKELVTDLAGASDPRDQRQCCETDAEVNTRDEATPPPRSRS